LRYFKRGLVTAKGDVKRLFLCAAGRDEYLTPIGDIVMRFLQISIACTVIVSLCLAPETAQAQPVLYVDDDAAAGGDGDTWATAFQHLQDALAAASASGGTVTEIRVAAGTYKPDQGQNQTAGNREATFQLLNGVALNGGYAGLNTPDPDARDIETNETILSGDLNRDDRPGFANNLENAYHVVTASGTDTTAVLDGVTITGGNANANSAGDPNGKGAGISNHGGSPTLADVTLRWNVAKHQAGMLSQSGDITLTSCTFIGNRAEGDCGGLGNSQGYASLTDCVFIENVAANGYSKRGDGGAFFNNGEAILLRCTFMGNSAERGGAVHSGSSTGFLTIKNCSFRDNIAKDTSSGGTGGAVANGGKGRMIISECTFLQNSAEGGGGGALSSHGRYCSISVSNCLFAENSAARGGGMYNSGSDSDTVVVNCRFHGNQATDKGGGFYDYSSLSGAAAHPILSSLINCVLSGNTATSGGALYSSGGDTTAINCSFAENSALETGGAIDHRGGHIGDRAVMHVVNAIFWRNLAAGAGGENAQIHIDDASIDVNYSLIEGLTGNFGGTGNIGDAPLFLDADGPDNLPVTLDDNLRLAEGSPCINSGDTTALPPDTMDLNGNGDTDEPIPYDLDHTHRVASGTVDLGPYEGARLALIFEGVPASVPEGETATFTVTPADNPQGSLQISISGLSGDPDISVQSGSTLRFNSGNYRIPQTVTLAAAPDPDAIAGVVVLRLVRQRYFHRRPATAPSQTPPRSRPSGSERSAVLGNGVTPLADIIAKEVDTSNPPRRHVKADATGANNGLSWSDAYQELQDALAEADMPGVEVSEVWVAEGTYKPSVPNGDRQATFQLVGGVGLYGGFFGTETERDQRDPQANTTILSGDLNDDDDLDPNNIWDNSEQVIRYRNENATTILDGFTITGGNSIGGFYSSGGGIHMKDAYGLVIKQCVFLGNTSGYGGAIACFRGSATVTDCMFLTNGSSNEGGAVRIQYSSFTLTNCEFRENRSTQGGAICAEYGSEVVISDCQFQDHHSGYGAAIYHNEGTLTLSRSTFSGNRAALGGALAIANAIVTVSDCTFMHNSNSSWNDGKGGAVSAYGSNTQFINCYFGSNEVSGEGYAQG